MTNCMSSLQFSPSKFKPWYRRPGPLVLIVSTAIFISGLVWLVLGGLKQVRTVGEEQILTTGQSRSKRLAAKVTATGTIQQVETADDPSIGPDNAPVSIVEFGDFECPYCHESFPIVRELMNTFEGKVRWQWRHFPLSDIHAQAQMASEASECAGSQGNFWGYHDKLFLNQPNFSNSALIGYAIQLGLDQEKFSTCLTSRTYRDKIERDLTDGIKAGVSGTPTFFINGRKVPGVIPRDIFATILEKAISAAKVP